MHRLNRQGLILSSLMLAALVAALCGPIHRFVPGWQPHYLVLAALLVALEAGIIHHTFRKEAMWLDELLRYVVPELFVMLLLMRVATALAGGGAPLAAQAQRWLLDPLSIFDVPFVLAIIMGTLVGLLSHVNLSDLLLLEPRETEAALNQRDDMQTVAAFARQDRADALRRIGARFVFGGALLLLALGVEAVDIRRITNPALPIAALSAGAAVLYFLAGFLLYSQGRLALLRARWRMDGAVIAADVSTRWTRISWLLIAGVVGAAALLPRSYGLGLLTTLQRSIGLIGYGLALIGYALTTLLTLVALIPIWLLSLLGGEGEQLPPLVAPELPPALEAPPPGAFEPRLWAALLFWACMGLLAVYACWIVIQRNPALRRALSSWGPLLWLIRQLGWLWRDTRAWVSQAGERVRELLDRRAPAPAPRGLRLRLRGLAPRELVRYFYRSTLMRAAAGGLPRRAGETPYEYNAALTHERPELQPDLAELTESFVLAEYAARPIDAEAARRARRPWERLRRRLRAR